MVRLKIPNPERLLRFSFMMSNIPETEWDEYIEKQTTTDWENLSKDNKQK